MNILIPYLLHNFLFPQTWWIKTTVILLYLLILWADWVQPSPASHEVTWGCSHLGTYLGQSLKMAGGSGPLMLAILSELSRDCLHGVLILLKASYASSCGCLGFPVAWLLDFKRQEVEAASHLKV